MYRESARGNFPQSRTALLLSDFVAHGAKRRESDFCVKSMLDNAPFCGYNKSVKLFVTDGLLWATTVEQKADECRPSGQPVIRVALLFFTVKENDYERIRKVEP